MRLGPVAVLVIIGAIGCHRAPVVERQPIGAPCRSDAACGSRSTFFCATDHPGGYCEAACSSDRDCPPEAVCVGGGPISKGACHKRCASLPDDCRASAGYRCIAAGQDATHDYCDPPGRSEVARRLRGRAWRW